jgi:hypothetical protein
MWMGLRPRQRAVLMLLLFWQTCACCSCQRLAPFSLAARCVIM